MDPIVPEYEHCASTIMDIVQFTRQLLLRLVVNGDALPITVTGSKMLLDGAVAGYERRVPRIA